jgi:tRNA dimethylallyltransferase
MEVVRRLPDVELVSLDSMQVYRGMDIGTAKPSASERAEVRHHLIDLVEPDDDMTVARFQEEAAESIADIEARGKRTLLVGGTGLYAQAVIDDLEIPARYPLVRAQLEGEPDTAILYRRLLELDPDAADRMQPTNRRRILRALEVTEGSGRPFSSYGPGLDVYPPTVFRLVGLRLPRDVLDRRIEERLRTQLDDGFVEEVAALARRPGGMSATARQALGYRELLGHVERGLPLEEAVDRTLSRTRRFARRQERWFRRDPRVHWVDVVGNPIDAVPQVLEALEWPIAE